MEVLVSTAVLLSAPVAAGIVGSTFDGELVVPPSIRGGALGAVFGAGFGGLMALGAVLAVTSRVSILFS